MPYFPPSDAPDAKAMLAALGLESVDQLFASIPDGLRRRAGIDLPAGLSEPDLAAAFRELAAKNRNLTETSSFTGAGIYPYPPLAAALYAMSRGEFLTAYTPYQPEISQGTLMAIYEFQTWIAELAGMPIANASMYDGATALAEAVLMGLRVRRKARTVYVAAAIAPTVRTVVDRYLAGQKGIDVRAIPVRDDGLSDLSVLREATDGPKVVALGSPNGYGLFEDVKFAREALDDKDFLVVHTPDPHAWMLVQPPGAAGADVAVAEGQPLGVPPSFGGPLLGLFAADRTFMRQMPGRLCGQTTDSEGRTGYVLTLSTREQHIRREKATSNICSNQGVIALLATVTMAVLGPAGLRQRAIDSARNARRLLAVLEAAGFQRRHAAAFFNEFVVDHEQAPAVWDRLVEAGVQLGVPLSRWDSADTTGLLVSATAMHRDANFTELEACLKTV